MLALQSSVSHDIINPIDTWKTDRIRTIPEFLNNSIRECLDRFFPRRCIIGHHLIIKHCIFIRVGSFHHFSRHLYRSRSTKRDVCLSFSTALGSYQNNAISSAYTEHSSSRSVLQDRYRLNFIRIYIIHTTFHTIYLN